jgi:PTS system ascorbate-specific IIA component
MFFFLVCHNPLGKALTKAIQHSLDNKMHELVVIDVLPTQTPKEISNILQQKWTTKNSPKSIIVLTDIIGATPSNGLHLWLSKTSVIYKGMAGINIPIFLSALSHKGDDLEGIFYKMKRASSNGMKELVS